jgi:hypothetical protein
MYPPATFQERNVARQHMPKLLGHNRRHVLFGYIRLLAGRCIDGNMYSEGD